MKPPNGLSERTCALLRKAAAECLAYPDPDRLDARLALLRPALAEVRGKAPGPVADLEVFLTWATDTPPLDRCAHYVETFDTRNRRSLYLTWWADGDTRRRGLSLVRLKQLYRAHGMTYAHEELPDFLPAVLEFAAVTGRPGDQLLQVHRVGLELLRLAVTDVSAPYAAVLEAVCTTLPGPSPNTKEQARRLAAAGPPQELVGIGAPPDAYGPAALPWPEPLSPEATG
ncbi:nitrate reductase molybdenum cofactor assembly chaperone [Streptomyces sp. NPDC017056]|uniref:nitrate reductase molybdenum cofactor assembly chaperone n=1 Tax=Streptomyces sp. NPDC017056 TaxID=3364973 RepID=UPI0037AD0C2E